MLTTLATQLRSLRTDRRGTTAIEYGLVAAGMAVLITAAIPLLNLTGFFTSIAALMVVP